MQKIPAWKEFLNRRNEHLRRLGKLPSFVNNLSSTRSEKEGFSSPSTQAKKSAPNARTAPLTKSYLIFQHIPGLPKWIEDVAFFWRVGCPMLGNVPIWLCRDMAYRKRKIHYYSDAKWKRSGQSCTMQGFKKILKDVVRDIDLDLSDVNNESVWNEAFYKFK